MRGGGGYWLGFRFHGSASASGGSLYYFPGTLPGAGPPLDAWIGGQSGSTKMEQHQRAAISKP